MIPFDFDLGIVQFKGQILMLQNLSDVKVYNIETLSVGKQQHVLLISMISYDLDLGIAHFEGQIPECKISVMQRTTITNLKLILSVTATSCEYL